MGDTYQEHLAKMRTIEKNDDRGVLGMKLQFTLPPQGFESKAY